MAEAHDRAMLASVEAKLGASAAALAKGDCGNAIRYLADANHYRGILAAELSRGDAVSHRIAEREFQVRDSVVEACTVSKRRR